ncbi:hypothetical protein QF205_13430 [Luteimonas composti]|uniref:SPOR domain-containing protein n=1 Tax=Luteimonas composti TaxID=398257 RepID=A0ABT6MTV8_9GAMM|nr:hypothetical protein [Luteimonas composti]MDH7454062.1 hypothetical protein [Luteimonas composti]
MTAKPLLLVPLALLLAACQERPATGQPAQDAQAAAAPSEPPAPATPARPFEAALPAGVTLSFRHHARSTKTVQDKEGASWERYTMEFLGSTPKDATLALMDDMRRAGFEAGKPKKRKGGYRVRFSREGYGEAIAIVRPAERDKLRHPEAAGVVQLAFPAAAGTVAAE